MTDLGTESLLGISDGLDAQQMRDQLALSTLYLANWYKATSESLAKTIGSTAPDQDIWWAKIDLVRAKIEHTYQDLLDPLSQLFAGPVAKADYDDASAAWASLYRELVLSNQTIDVSLLDEAAGFGTTLATAPGLLLPWVGNEIGKAAGGALGNFLARTWPYLAGAGALYGIYLFRRPLAVLAGKVGA